MKVTRRSLAVLAAGALQAQEQQQVSAPKYTGAMDKFESQVNPSELDPVAWTLKRYDEMPRHLRFGAKSRGEAEAWQRKLRSKLMELIGGFPVKRVPLQAKSLEKREFETYTREAVVFQTREGVTAFGYVLVPKQGKGPFPVAICIPGHGRGVDDIVGVDKEGSDRTVKEQYQFDFALQAVEHGMAAVAIEPMGFGCRRGAQAKKSGLGTSSCQPAAGAALMFGETMIGWRVLDVMRTIDYIETRGELDSKRIGCVGISGGGTATLFSSALEPRIKAALVSGYLNSFRDSVVSLSHCIDNYVPGLLQWAEMSDIAGLVAPRALWAESGEKDNIFPIEASKKAYADVRAIYEVFGAADKCGHEVFAGGHMFSGARGWPFLKSQLMA